MQKPSTILLDIEGTTSAIAYVYDVLFPYVRKNMDSFLTRTWDDDNVAKALDLMAVDAGAKNFREWAVDATSQEQQKYMLLNEVNRLMDLDLKTTGLKQLQGLILQDGYERKELKSHVFPDVPPALERWHKVGIDIRIYSSGSVQAQKVFFSNTEYGDLTYAFRAFYDTTIGAKRDAESYRRIRHDINHNGDILFLSDVQDELDAAKESGLRTVLVIRPGNAETKNVLHQQIGSFDELSFG